MSALVHHHPFRRDEALGADMLSLGDVDLRYGRAEVEQRASSTDDHFEHARRVEHPETIRGHHDFVKGLSAGGVGKEGDVLHAISPQGAWALGERLRRGSRRRQWRLSRQLNARWRAIRSWQLHRADGYQGADEREKSERHEHKNRECNEELFQEAHGRGRYADSSARQAERTFH